MTLMAGPIDTRVNPTKVNELANSQADRLVREEPDRERAVPLSAARAARSIRASCSSPPSCSMNIERHVKAHRELYEQPSAAASMDKAEDHQGFLRRIFRRARSAGRVLSGDRAVGVPGAPAAQGQARPGTARRSSRAPSGAPRCSPSRASATTSARSARRSPRTISARACGPTASATTCRPASAITACSAASAGNSQIYPLVKNVILSSE